MDEANPNNYGSHYMTRKNEFAVCWNKLFKKFNFWKKLVGEKQQQDFLNDPKYPFFQNLESL